MLLSTRRGSHFPERLKRVKRRTEEGAAERLKADQLLRCVVWLFVRHIL